MTDSEANDERVSVRTYVPAYQREEWDDHADELGMSRSEFVRTMVQAGRRGFFEEPDEPESPTVDSSGPDPKGSSGETDLEDQVIGALSRGAYLPWEDLLQAVTEDIERRLEETLQTLQSSGRVRYSGRNGGYTIDEQ